MSVPKVTLSPQAKEELARYILSKNLGMELVRGKLVIGKNKFGMPLFHEFDAVSKDGEVVGEIKSNRLGRNQSSFNLVLADCFFLAKMKARRKFMVLTNRRLYNFFLAKTAGILPSGIEVIHIQVELQSDA